MKYYVADSSSDKCDPTKKDTIDENNLKEWAVKQTYVKTDVVNLKTTDLDIELIYRKTIDPIGGRTVEEDSMLIGSTPSRTSLTIDCSIGDKIVLKKMGTDEIVGRYIVLGERTGDNSLNLLEGEDGIDEPFEWHEYSRFHVARDCVRQLNYNYMTNVHSIDHFDTLGFKKTRVPEAAMPLIEAWLDKEKKDIDAGLTEPHSMHWQHLNAADAYMTGLSPPAEVSNEISEIVRPIIEEFMGTPLKFSVMSAHIYNNNSVVAPHTDNPYHHVVGVIMNVEMDTDEPWMLVVVDHMGKQHTMPTYPGDMVIYEAATIIHSRPYHMRGRRVSNAFLHYQPHNWAVSDYAQWDEPYNNN